MQNFNAGTWKLQLFINLNGVSRSHGAVQVNNNRFDLTHEHRIFSAQTASKLIPRLREMLYPSTGGRSPLQHPPLSLLLVGILRIRAEAPGPGTVPPPPPPGPQGAQLTRKHLRGRWQRRRGSLRTAGPRGRTLPGLLLSDPAAPQDAGRGRAVSGCKAEASRCGN